MWYSKRWFVCLDKWVSNCLIKIKTMTQYEKMLFEVLINYIPKISGSLEDIVDELRKLNEEKKLNDLPKNEEIWKG
mgnify:FL=1